MSSEKAAEFWAQARQDQSLVERLSKTMAGTKDVLHAVSELGAEAGYQFTAQELAEVIRNETVTAELTEHDLDGVAGGVGLLLPAVQKIRDAALHFEIEKLERG